MQKRNMLAPDETRTFDKGKLELVTNGGVTFGRATLIFIDRKTERKSP
jgi:hypothetical protein